MEIRGEGGGIVRAPHVKYTHENMYMRGGGGGGGNYNRDEDTPIQLLH